MKGYTQSITVEGVDYGCTQRGGVSRGEYFIQPTSFLFLCPDCGEIWAKSLLTETITGKYCRFQALHYPCRKCSPKGYYLIPGSILVEHHPEHNEAVLALRLKEEFDLHMARLEGRA